MDWLHCNNCCKQPRSRDNDFIMTSCGHIFCKRCESREDIDHCLFCKLKCRTIPLVSTNMRPEIRMYFEDLEEKLSTLSNIARFQKNHRINMFKKQKRVFESYKNVKQENNLLRKKLVEAQKQIQTLRKQKDQFLQKTPSMNNMESRNHRYSAICTSASLNPHTPAQDVYENTHAAFQFIQPHLKNHPDRYRNHARGTPACNGSIPSNSSTGFANQFQRHASSSAFAKPQDTPKVSRISQKGPTPLYNAMKGMNITDMRRNRK